MYQNLLLLLLLAGSHALFGQDSIPQRMLFVGNSYTYFWNLPQSVQAMAKEQGIAVEIRQSTAGGVNLGQHWRGEKGLSSQAKIKQGDFDLVVLQDFSLQAIKRPDSLRIYSERFIDLVRENGGSPVMYMTWARRWDSTMLDPIAAAYEAIALEQGIKVAPVGKAWNRARKLRPDLALYHPDGSHPSPAGTYLTACVMYAILFDRSPLGLPARLKTMDRNGEILYLNIQTAEDAAFLQKVAQEMTRDMITDH